MLKLSGIIFVVIFGILGVMFFQGQKPPSQTLMEMQEIPEPGIDVYSCEQDIDCIPITEECCDCNQGGRQIAINRKYYKDGLDERSDQCLLASCQNAVSTHISCTKGKATCVSGQCQMK